MMKTLANLLTSIAFIFAFFQLNAVAQNSSEYFEGEVTFSVEHESINSEIPTDYFYYLFGNSMTGIVTEKKYKTITKSLGLGISTTYYDLENKKVYMESSESDTIRWYPLDEENGELISVQRNKEEKKFLFDGLRESVTIEYIPNNPNIERIVGTFYFHPDYKLNKELYANHKYSFWNLFINESGSISIRNESYIYPLFKSIAQVTNIEEREVLDSELEFDKTKILVRGEDPF
ncbi:MAG: hypothetical protein ED557_04375 [Balneola sp.]|nr:MAG: hypothetical protein ED557_04375 [Balneola sp.]